MKVYIDQGVNRKKLIRLAGNFNLEIVHVGHYEQSFNHAKSIPGVFVLDQSRIDGGDYLAGDDIQEVKEIMEQNGEKHSLDIAHIYSAYHSDCKYFVTNNPKDIIRDVRNDPASNGKRKKLEALLVGIRIVTIEELEAELEVQY